MNMNIGTKRSGHLVSRASRIFPCMRMRVRKWAGGGKEKYVWVDLTCQVFMAPAQDPEAANQTAAMHVN